MNFRPVKKLSLSICLVLFLGCYAQSLDKSLIDDSINTNVTIERINNQKTKQIYQTKATQNQTLKSYLVGGWKRDFENGGCSNLWINFPSSSLCVVSNQIYILVSYKLNKKENKVYVYFKKTSDVGEWAIKLHWKDFDNRKPIAIIDVSKAISEGTIDVKWLGFVNKKTGEVYDFGKDDHEGIHHKQVDDK
jgi:hypothetical protein